MISILAYKKICVICGKSIDDDSIKIMKDFIENSKDKLFFINDLLAHKKCFGNLPEIKIIGKLEKKCHENKQKLKCDICNEELINSNDTYIFNCLSSDETDPLYKYNFFKVHKLCFDTSQIGLDIKTVIKYKIQNANWIFANYKTFNIFTQKNTF